MTKQAENSLNLYRGNDPSKIEQLLKIQKASVVTELKNYFGTTDLHELALKLSIA